MAKILTSSDCQEIWAESEENGTFSYQCKNSKHIVQGKSRYLGKAESLELNLRNGLSINYYQLEFNDDIIWLKEVFDRPQFGLSFFLSGKVKIDRHSLTGTQEELVGYYYSDCNCDFKETEWWQGGEKYTRIYIEIEPQQFFNSFQEEDFNQIPPFLRWGMNLQTIKPHYQQGKITRLMQKTLSQILACPYEGLMQQIYLESKAVELIALYFEQYQEKNQQKTLNDRERIYQAREILQKNLENPPSLKELARLVGLNDFKLKQGFRQVFGTSAFKYLHDYRLEQAKQLLTSKQMRVEDVALIVGFGNRSYFASAFRQKYGVNPKQFQKIYN
jgi:AraC family transcriptional regulator, transcriptional activator of the genes for pyochelin and ferripyochelin receptors